MKRHRYSDPPQLKKKNSKKNLDYTGPIHPNLPEYGGFRAGEDITWTCGWTEEAFTVTLFIGIPADLTLDPMTDDTNRYLCLGKVYAEVFMRKDDVYNRLVNKDPSKFYQTDFGHLDNMGTTGASDILPVWYAF